ncbi:MAG: endolytic transglycosylase MltG, partial [Pseudomonadales bacterium]
MLGLLGLVSLLFLGAGTWLLRQPLALEGSLCFDLKPGAAGPQLQKVLKAQSGPAERFALRLYLRLSGVGKTLQAGEYCLDSGETLLSTLGKLRRGAVHERTLRIGEGWTLRDLERALRAAERLDRADLGATWVE